MDILARELTIEGDEYIALGTRSDYLPLYRRMEEGYYGVRMIYFALLKWVAPDRIGEEETLTEKQVEERYGLLMDTRPRPVSPEAANDAAQDLPLARMQGGREREWD